MQTIWSRTVQSTCTCRCPSCVFTKAVLARRQVATVRRLLTRPLQSATFTYSAIFAGACLVDGKLKNDKRKELNATLAEARRTTATQAHARTSQFKAEALITQERRATGVYDLQTGSENEGDFTWDELRRYEIEGKGRPDRPQTLGHTLAREHFPPQSLYATTKMKSKVNENQLSDRKLRMLEITIAQLVLEILINAGLYQDGSRDIHQYPQKLHSLLSFSRAQMNEKLGQVTFVANALRKVPQHAFDDAYLRFQDFLNENQWIPVYENSPRSLSAVKEQNKRLFQEFSAFIQSPKMNYKDVAVRVCDTLLCFEEAASASPNYATWNILLMGFAKIGRDQVVSRICDALDLAKVRPNELTCALVINHFSKVGDAKGFTKFIDTLRGLQGGIMLARPDLAITPENAPRLVLKEGSNQRKLIQKIAPTPLVYNALISGMLKFFGPDFARNFCQELHGDGWGIDKKVLGQLLHAYAIKRDWEGGLRVWRQAQKLIALPKVESSTASHLQDVDYMLAASILQLCLRTARKSEFNQIFDSAIARKFDRKRLQEFLQKRVWRPGDTIPKFIDSSWRQRQATIQIDPIAEEVASGAPNHITNPIESSRTTAYSFSEAGKIEAVENDFVEASTLLQISDKIRGGISNTERAVPVEKETPTFEQNQSLHATEMDPMGTSSHQINNVTTSTGAEVIEDPSISNWKSSSRIGVGEGVVPLAAKLTGDLNNHRVGHGPITSEEIKVVTYSHDLSSVYEDQETPLAAAFEGVLHDRKSTNESLHHFHTTDGPRARVVYGAKPAYALA